MAKKPLPDMVLFLTGGFIFINAASAIAVMASVAVRINIFMVFIL